MELSISDMTIILDTLIASTAIGDGDLFSHKRQARLDLANKISIGLQGILLSIDIKEKS